MDIVQTQTASVKDTFALHYTHKKKPCYSPTKQEKHLYTLDKNIYIKNQCAQYPTKKKGLNTYLKSDTDTIKKKIKNKEKHDSGLCIY